MARIRVHLYGDKHARRLLLQPVDSQELKLMDSEVEELTKLTGGTNWCLVAMEVHDWNKELSPWEAPAVFGDEPFGHDADRTLNDIIWYIHTFCKMYPGRPREFYLGGYSLAGFFALWTGSLSALRRRRRRFGSPAGWIIRAKTRFIRRASI